MTAFKDLHSFIDYLETTGELRRIREPVSTRLEIAEICDRVSKKPSGGSALLFENVLNHNNGQKSPFPVLINALGSAKRMNSALGVGHPDELANQIRELIKTQPPGSFIEKLKLLPTLAKLGSYTPKKASSGPCQEVVLTGSDIDLTQFPILHCWPDDGGSFITFGCV